ncbi:hypothetical protein C0581_03545 [Candidatus Parcubacteria bacterium]|nr:MAG: hypothetical protein C0581_03545 [Candidatus Parcubacteria bacterium]
MDLEKEILLIKERNQKVELNKAWENSLIRKVMILVLTYGVIVLFMYVSDIERPWLNATVPSVGFFLSTLTLPFIKEWWIKKNFK